MDDSNGYEVTFDGETWFTAGMRDYVSVPVQQADVIRLELYGDVIATLTYGPATRTYSILGVWPADQNVMEDHPDKVRDWRDWRDAMRWIADLLSGGDRAQILKAVERY